MRTCARAVGVLLTLAAMAAWPASASAENEPANNRLSGADGPISGGVPVTGTFTDENDVDWYVLYVTGPTQLSVTQDAANECVRIEFYDSDGGELSLPYTPPPGYARYFLRLRTSSWSRCTLSYSFTVQPAGSVQAGPPMPVPVGTVEPNETATAAAGPLAGDVWYSGVLETTNDEDWMTFYLAPGTHQLDLAATVAPLGGGCSESASLFAGYPSESSRSVTSAYISSDTISHGRVTVTGPERYFVQVDADGSSDVGCAWAVSVSPGGALTPTLLVPPSPAPAAPSSGASTSRASASCRSARNRARSARKRMIRYRAVYRRSRGAKRARYVRRYRIARKQLNRAYRDRRVRCPNGR